MFKKFVQLSALAAAAQAEGHKGKSDHWAVITVGSQGYMNYRHHADGCHAYKQAIENGIPEENIIMIAYDNVPDSKENPYRGKLFNKPTKKGVEGIDVYKGCKIDYKGSKANKETLLGVLKGDPSVGDKYLKSNTESKVFFYFADHGAPGLVAMPVGKALHADELNEAINYMHENKMYKEMVMYIEACESGSMFKKLKKDIKVYATTAANGHESSWGTYCHPDDEVNGKHIGSCLGDLYSVNWMEDLDKAKKEKKMGTESLQMQYDTVKEKTKKSHVLQWGDISAIAPEAICEFEADKCKDPKDFWTAFKQIGKDLIKDQIGWEGAEDERKNDFAVDVRDINLHYLYSKVVSDPSLENQKALMDELDHRLTIDKRFDELFPTFNDQVKKRDFPLPESTEDHDCYRNMLDIYENQCGKSDTYTMKYFGNFLHLCKASKYYSAALDDYKVQVPKVCQNTE